MAQAENEKNRSKPKSSEAEAGATVKVADLIKSLLADLSPEVRAAVLREINEHVQPIPVHRAGDVLAKIAQLFANKKQWSIDDLRKKLIEIGIEATAKEVYNAIGYLSRKGHVQRIGYGRYIIGGAVIETSDELGGEDLRNDDEYRTGRDQTNASDGYETPNSENGKNV